jgi:hypothetical protein
VVTLYQQIVEKTRFTDLCFPTLLYQGSQPQGPVSQSASGVSQLSCDVSV